MKSLIAIVAVSVLTATLGGTTCAADVQEKKPEAGEQHKALPDSARQAHKEMLQMSRAGKIIGTRVKNPGGDNLGDIKDLVLDPKSGQISYAVISFGGVLGMGSKLFAIPWRLLQWNRNDEYYLLDLNKDILRKAPGFDKNHWPDSSDKWEQWSEEINQFYHDTP
ncbi:MAG: PRC-barrel domain-containing protein [Methylococcaceae bacterium]